MADNWRPGPWQGLRNSSTHQPSPRPPAQRAMSNVESLDPRRRPHPYGNDSRKRPTSQSPEPERAHKQARTGQSSATASPRDPTPSRRASTQLKADLRKDSEGGIPSPASPFHGSGSGQSTPQQMVAPVANMDAPLMISNKVVDAAENPVFAALRDFSNQMATQASLLITQQQAKQAYSRACKDYKRLQGGFRDFPALKEKWTQAREHARIQLKQADEEMAKHAASGQQSILENLTSLITSAAHAKPEQDTRTDIVSRDELNAIVNKQDALTKEQNTFSSSLNAVQSRLAITEDGFAEGKRKAVELAVSVSQASATSQGARTAADEAKKASTEATRLSQNASKLAVNTSAMISTIKADTEQSLTDNSNDTRRKIEDVTKMFNDTRATANEALRTAKDAKIVSGHVSHLQDQIARMKNDVERLSAGNSDESRGSLQARIDKENRTEQALRGIEALREEMDQSSRQYALKEDVGEMGAKIDTLSQDVAGVRKSNAALKKELGVISADNGARTPTQQRSSASKIDADYRSRVDQLWNHKIFEDGPKLVEEFDALKEQTSKLQELTLGESEPSAEKMQSSHGNLLSWTTSIARQLRQTREDIEDPAKRTIQERFDELDDSVKHMQAQIGESKKSLPTRVSDLETKLDALQKAESARASAVTVPPTSQSSLEEGEFRSQQTGARKESKDSQRGNLMSRVPDLEQRFHALHEEVTELKRGVRIDSTSGHVTVNGDVEERLANVEKDLETLRQQQDRKHAKSGDWIMQVEKKLTDFEAQQEEKDNLVFESIGQESDKMRTDLQDLSKYTHEEVARLDDLVSSQKTDCVRRNEASTKELERMMTKEAFQNHESSLLRPLLDDVSRMKTEVKDIRERSRSTSMPAPPAPPVSQSPQLPNGVSSPLMTGPPQRVPTPQGQRVLTPQGPPAPEMAHMQSQVNGIINQMGGMHNQMKGMQNHFDAIIGVQQHLKLRVDNMVTDDIVKAMSDQIITMFPEARDFSSAIKALTKRLEAVENEIRAVKQSSAGNPEESQAMRTRMEKLETSMREANDLAARLEAELMSIKTTVATLKNSSPDPSVTSEDLKDLRKAVEEAVKTARGAELLSKGHATRFTNLEPEAMKEAAEKLKGEVGENRERIDGVMGKVGGLQEEVNELAAASGRRDAAVKALEEALKKG